MTSQTDDDFKAAMRRAFLSRQPEIDRLKRQVDERDRLLRWAASDFEKHGINNDNWYADYEALAAADKINQPKE